MKAARLFILILCGLTLITGCSRREEIPDTKKITNEPINLVFYSLFDNTDAFKGQIQAFQSKYPNIKIRYEKFTNPQEYEDLIVNEIAEGQGPDIFAIHNGWITKHQGKLASMPLDLSVPMNPAKFQETFFDVAAKDLIIENKIYGLPLSIDTLALFYNKEYFISAVPGANSPANTWEKIKKQVIALTKQDNSRERFNVAGIAMGRSDNISRAIDILYLLMLQFETNFYNEEGTQSIIADKQGTIEGTGQAYFPGIHALELFSSFGLPSYNHYSWNDLITGENPENKEIGAFARGKVAMIFGYSYLYEELQREINTLEKLGKTHIKLTDIQIKEVPQLLDPKLTNKRFAFASYFPLVVSKNSKHQRAAWEFIQYLSSKESLQTYFEKTHNPTSRLDMQAEQALDPIYGAFSRQANYARSYKIIDHEFYNTIITQAISDVISTITPKKALFNAQQKINCLLYKKAGVEQYRGIDCLINK